MTSTTRRWAGRVSLCTAAIISLPAALAQETDDKGGPVRLEEIVVTATKRTEALQDVPVAITAITAADIEARGFTNYSDYINTVPNMFMQDLGPGAGTRIYIRGLVAEGGSGFPVATYFGEAVTSVLTNNGGFANLRLVDIDRVEVLRGPQGTLFGANSLAGVLRVVPNAPDLNDFQVNIDARGWSTAHSDNGSEHFEGVINLPIISDRLAARLVAYQDHIAGFLDNVVPAAAPFDYSAGFGAPDGTLVIPGHAAFTRKDINSEDTWGARGAVTWKPTDSLHLDLSYVAQEVRLNSEAGAQPAFGDYVIQRPLDLYGRGEQLEEQRIGQFVVGYDWSAVSLTSATAYTRLERYQDEDISFLAAAAGLGSQLWALQDRSKGESFTQEFRAQSRGDAPFQWLAGYFYTNTNFDLGQYVPDYSCPTCLPEVLYGQPFAIQTIGTTIGEKQRQQSIFAEGSYSITSQWTLGAGGRYLRDYLESLESRGRGSPRRRHRGRISAGGRSQFHLQSFRLHPLQSQPGYDLLPAGLPRIPQRYTQPGTGIRSQRSVRRDRQSRRGCAADGPRLIVDLRTGVEVHLGRRSDRGQRCNLPPEMERRAARRHSTLRVQRYGQRWRCFGQRCRAGNDGAALQGVERQPDRIVRL